MSAEKSGVDGTANPQPKVVLFADILGFAALIEQHELDVPSLRNSERLDTIFGSIFKKNPLTHAFTEFHRAIQWGLRLSQLRHSATAITFSDSAFIATTRLSEAAGIAIYLMQSLMRREIPLRIGIAYGSFEAVRFRSDITADSGDHAAQFLGAGVVRAHLTESCGIKGCRILLHPSAAALLEDPAHNPILPSEPHVSCISCAASECENRAGVRSEINYWSLKPTEEKETWRAFQSMWDSAPEAEYPHYQATAEAINRMRMARGAKCNVDLRRRTLERERT